MAAALSAADLDKALLAALRAAVPEQVGDDLVLRLPDGRSFFIDGFFALDEIGDGLAPEPGAIELAREIADLLLGAPEIDTAAGGEPPVAPPSSGVGFEPLQKTPTAEPEDPEAAAEEEEEDADEIDDVRGLAREFSRTQQQDDGGTTSFAGGGSGVSLNLRAIGAISLAAGGADAPTWQNAFDLRAVVRLEDLADPAADGWFPGLTRLLAWDDPADFATFLSVYDPTGIASPADFEPGYQIYLATRAEWVQLAGDRTVWANLTPAEGSFGDRDNSLADNLPGGISPEILFSGGDLIIGTNDGWDRLHGFDGNDILVGYHGDNHLVGGAGDDVLITSQRPNSSVQTVIEGGEGDDTLIVVIDNETWPFRLGDLGTVSSVERLILSPQDMALPDYLGDDYATGRIVNDNLVLDLDAASIHAWGGHLVIDGAAADIRLADIANWERLPADPADPGYVHYRTTYAGETVTLAVHAGADQPIAGVVTGTPDDDIFYLGHRRFGLIDGGAGNDQVYGGIDGGPLGDLDLGDPATAPFRNIENFMLDAVTDSITLSAASVAAMTDARNTLWLTGTGFGVANVNPDGLGIDGSGFGQVHLLDAAAWTALGYLTVETAAASQVETRMGAVYGATIGGENVYLFVHVGLQQPVVANVAAADYWFVDHAGWVSLPRADIQLNLAVVDLDNGFANQIILSVAAADRLAGPDGILTLAGDAGQDIVHFVDMPDWRFGGIENGYAIYHGDDQDGHQATLRIEAALLQPALLPDPDAGDLDLIDLTNGRADQLVFDVETAAHYAGANGKLEIFGNGDDRLAFEHPEDWRLVGRDGGFLIYEGDDGSTQATIRVHDQFVHPLFLPTFTDGDDRVMIADLLVVEQYHDLDGKDGFDILHLMDTGLIQPPLDFMKHVEAIDMTNGVANTFAVHASTLQANDIAGPLFITGDAKDSVALDTSAVPYDLDVLGTVTNAAVSANAFTLYQMTIHYQTGDVTAQIAIDQALIQPAIPL